MEDTTGDSGRFRLKFKKLLEEAIDEREKGDVLKSIELFLRILLLHELRLMDRLLVRNHLGLAYFHAGSRYYDKAVDNFELVIDMSNWVGCTNDGFKAVALRNLSRPQFIGYGDVDTIHDCDLNIYNARQIAKDCGRKDLVWFTHGMVSLRIFEGYINSDTRMIFWEEVKEWLTLAKNEGKMERQVWLLGIFADFVRLYPLIPVVPTLKIAKWFAHKNNLARREEQIQKALNQVTEK